ncbi:VOC family protein [Phycicoccus sp. CSK15P-2]|uniref:VOC family protein n=1 Tax=Phycicoccus sp. CSK15P-2 TaxID=2807627 RepID=UPI0019519322|nr:VOC family protein [Phycicoccus sp. CSK15P-2]MBM6403976.1 VOC family protein [Phycicoccus sp. CSK15P-2]
MTIQTTTHLNFRGDAREALEFYRSVFGGHAVINTYADFGMPKDVPGADKVVFGLVASDTGFRVMGYDVPGETGGTITGGTSTRRENNTTLTDQALFVSVNADTLEEAQSYWDGLAAGSTVVEPLAASDWSPGFGMLTDRFGVTWSVGVTAA